MAYNQHFINPTTNQAQMSKNNRYFLSYEKKVK